jgi:hypothetical protein
MCEFHELVTTNNYVYVMIYDCPNLIIIAYNYRMYSALPTSPLAYELSMLS